MANIQKLYFLILPKWPEQPKHLKWTEIFIIRKTLESNSQEWHIEGEQPMWNAFCIVQLIRATANPFSRQVPFLFRCCCCFVSFCFTAYYRNLGKGEKGKTIEMQVTGPWVGKEYKAVSVLLASSWIFHFWWYKSAKTSLETQSANCHMKLHIGKLPNNFIAVKCMDVGSV